MTDSNRLRAGMVGMGMIFDETYRPLFESLHADGFWRKDLGAVDVELIGVATRTGTRAAAVKKSAAGRIGDFKSVSGDRAIDQLVSEKLDPVCVATPMSAMIPTHTAILVL